MKNNITPNIFINFTKHLKILSNTKNLNKIIKKNSKLIIHILFNNSNLYKNYLFLQHITNTKFLTPHKIKQNYQTLTLKNNLKFKKKNQLLYFQNSTLPKHKNLI